MEKYVCIVYEVFSYIEYQQLSEILEYLKQFHSQPELYMKYLREPLRIEHRSFSLSTDGSTYRPFSISMIFLGESNNEEDLMLFLKDAYRYSLLWEPTEFERRIFHTGLLAGNYFKTPYVNIDSDDPYSGIYKNYFMYLRNADSSDISMYLKYLFNDPNSKIAPYLTTDQIEKERRFPASLDFSDKDKLLGGDILDKS